MYFLKILLILTLTCAIASCDYLKSRDLISCTHILYPPEASNSTLPSDTFSYNKSDDIIMDIGINIETKEARWSARNNNLWGGDYVKLIILEGSINSGKFRLDKNNGAIVIQNFIMKDGKLYYDNNSRQIGECKMTTSQIKN